MTKPSPYYENVNKIGYIFALILILQSKYFYKSRIFGKIKLKHLNYLFILTGKTIHTY